MNDTAEPKSMQIGKHTYTVRYMPPGEGLEVLCHLMNIIGPGVKGFGADGDSEKLATFIGELLSNEKLAERVEYFTKVFRKHTSVSGGEYDGDPELSKIYDSHFRGNYFELIRWISFCFEVNHSSFLEELGVSARGVADLIVQRLRSQSQKAPAQPGPSGA